MMTIGQRISKVRKSRGLTQDDLAKQLNVSRQTVSNWENGRISPDVDTLSKMSVVLDFNFFDEIQPDKENIVIQDLKIPPVETVVTSRAPSAKSSAQDEKPEDSADTENAENNSDKEKPRKNIRKIWIAAGALLLAVLIAGGVLIGLHSRKAVITASTSDTEVPMVETDGRPFWQTDFVFANDGKVSFFPESVVLYFYSGNDVYDRIKIDTEELSAYYDKSEFQRSDKPMVINVGTDHPEVTRMEAILFGKDDNDHSLQFSVSVPMAK